METSDFENIVEKHTLPGTGGMYAAVAFAGEVGEVCNIVKKIQMVMIHPSYALPTHDNPYPLIAEDDLQAMIIDELGDSLFYLTRLALNSGVSLDYLMQDQLAKLEGLSFKHKRIFLK